MTLSLLLLILVLHIVLFVFFFATLHNLLTHSIPLIELQLFDGTTNNTITGVVNLPLRFPMGTSMIVDFYITPLDSSAFMVLGHNWLTHYNPLIGWALDSVSFHSTGSDPPTRTQTTSAHASTLLQCLHLSDSAPKVSLVSTAAFKLASCLEGSQTFQLFIAPTSGSASAKSVSVSDKKIDLSAIHTF